MSGTHSGDLDTQTAFDILSSRRRRIAMTCLREHGGRATIGDLARQVAARENDVAEARVTRRQRKRAYTALRQSHLPRMADAGVVDYDQDRGHVELTSLANDIWPYLEEDGTTPNWRRLHLSVASTVALGILGTVADLPLMGALPVVAWLLALVVGVATLLAAQAATRPEPVVPWPVSAD